MLRHGPDVCVGVEKSGHRVTKPHLPWHKPQDLDKLEPRRDPPEGGEMRQRGGSEQPVKGRRANGPKARKVSTAAPSMADLQNRVGILTRERDDALEQQRAAAEVLKIISASPSEFRPVLEVIVESAARFCDADDVTIFELDGPNLCITAHRGAVLSQEIGVRFPCTRGSVAGRTVIDRKAVHVIDLQAEADEFPEGSTFARRFGHRTTAN